MAYLKYNINSWLYQYFKEIQYKQVDYAYIVLSMILVVLSKHFLDGIKKTINGVYILFLIRWVHSFF